jgi:hypothetical protein
MTCTFFDRFVAVDASNPATLSLPAGALWDPHILALLKAQTLKPHILNNRYSVFGLSHLAFIPGTQTAPMPAPLVLRQDLRLRYVKFVEAVQPCVPDRRF